MKEQLSALTSSKFWGYNTDTSDSDYLILEFPSREDLFFNKSRGSKQKDVDGNDLLIKDIRTFCRGLRAGNLRFYEALSSMTINFVEGDKMLEFYKLAQLYKEYLFEMGQEDLRFCCLKELDKYLNDLTNGNFSKKFSKEEYIKILTKSLKLKSIVETNTRLELCNLFSPSSEEHLSLGKWLKDFREQAKNFSEESLDSYIVSLLDFSKKQNERMKDFKKADKNNELNRFDYQVPKIMFK